MKVLFEFLIITSAIAIVINLWILSFSIRKNGSHAFLFLFFIQLLLIQIDFYVTINKISILKEDTNLWSNVLSLSLAPTFFVFIHSASKKSKKPWSFFLIHLIPVILYTFIVGISYFASIFEFELDIFNELTHAENQYFALTTNLYSICYFILCAGYVIKNKLNPISGQNGFIANDLLWLFLVIVLANLAFFSNIYFVISEVIYEKTIENSSLITYTLFSELAIITSIWGIKNIKFAPSTGLKEINTNVPPETTEVLNAPDLKVRLYHIMSEEKPYLNVDLDLHELAKLTGTTQKKLSLLLNNYMQTNFYEFVNGYRIEAVKEALLEPSNNIYSIMGIANECGFKSKSTFNRIFKQATNLSPKEFRKLHAQEPCVD